jgi:hypothetical protein
VSVGSASGRATESRFADLARLADSFDAAADAAGGTHDARFCIAGAAVCFRSANAEMTRRLTHAFGHLPAPAADAAADLTVRLWDSASGGTSPPPLPDTRDEEAPGAFFYYSDEIVRAGFQLGTSGDARVLAVYPEAPTPALSVLESNGESAWYWVADAGRIPYWEQATPMVYLLDWWLRDRGMHMLHAGAVGDERGGIVLVGKSGSGKSTATLSVLQSDLGYAGDDYVGVTIGAKPHVHGLYSSGKLMPNHVERLPFLLDALSNRSALDVEKAVVYAHEHWPSNMSAGFPLRAVVAPRVTPGLLEARMVPIPRAAGLAALAPSTVFQMHTRGQDSLIRARMLVESVPSFRLELGSDMASIPRAISALLSQLED